MARDGGLPDLLATEMKPAAPDAKCRRGFSWGIGTPFVIDGVARSQAAPGFRYFESLLSLWEMTSQNSISRMAGLAVGTLPQAIPLARSVSRAGRYWLRGITHSLFRCSRGQTASGI